jgi:hypothetical protein
VEGYRDTGIYHKITGSYKCSGCNEIDVRVERIDGNGCVTYNYGTLTIIDQKTIRAYYPTGWDGCGVKTGPGGELWRRDH